MSDSGFSNLGGSRNPNHQPRGRLGPDDVEVHSSKLTLWFKASDLGFRVQDPKKRREGFHVCWGSVFLILGPIERGSSSRKKASSIGLYIMITGSSSGFRV